MVYILSARQFIVPSFFQIQIYNFKSMKKIYLFIILAITLGAVSADAHCGVAILGCDKCETLSAVSQLSTALHTCTRCEPNLYLYKWYNPTAEQYQNVCVPDCYHSDQQTQKDEANKQCIYLGPYCSYSSTVKHSVTGKPVPQCAYSYMQDHGFTLGSRWRLMNYMNNETWINPNTSLVNSTNALKLLSQRYISPLERSSFTNVLAEQNVQVVAQCQSKYCNLCEDFNTTKCVTCWGRFGDSSRFQKCLLSQTCNSLNTDGAFKTGCYRTASDCFGCEICDTGFVRQADGTCYNCTLLDGKCSECSGFIANNSVTCDVCADGYGLSSDNKTCFKCAAAQSKTCQKDVNGTERTSLCYEGQLLNTDGQCRKFCKFDEFPQIIYDAVHNTEDSVYCAKCNSSCRSCNFAGDQNCESCNNDKFLNISSATERKGPCANKTQVTNTTLQVLHILVRNAANSSLPITDPLVKTDLMAALFQAYENATEYSNLTVNIVLETGSHYILPSHLEAFDNRVQNDSHVDLNNAHFNLTVRPLECGEQLAYGFENATNATRYRPSNTTACRPKYQPGSQVNQSMTVNDDPTKQSYLINKVGSFFKVQVPRALRWSGIIFDALDSVQIPQSTLANTARRDCVWTQAEKPVCSATLLASEFVDLWPNQVCSYRSYDSIFQFRTIDRPLMNETDIPSLEIVDCKFQNIFYEIGSIVRLPEHNRTHAFDSRELPWRLSIEGTLFKNMSFCGSIVSNDFPQFEGTDDSYVQEFNYGMINQIQSQYQITPSMNFSLDCKVIECFKFRFQNNTIDTLNLFKRKAESFFAQAVNWQMQKFGVGIHLRNFKGNVEIRDNVIQNILYNFNDFCLLYQTSANKGGERFDMTYAKPWLAVDHFDTPNVNAETRLLIPRQKDAHQLSSIIVIDNLSPNKSISIVGNHFKDNVVTNSLISISQSTNNAALLSNASSSAASGEGTITVSNNSFSSSQSYIGTNLILVTKQDHDPRVSVTSIDHHCGKGIDISYNNFTSIVGTCLVDTGLVRVQCNNTRLARLTVGDFSDYYFINQTRQQATSQGPEGMSFNQSSIELLRWRFENDSSIDSTKVNGNKILNVSLGIAQKTRYGTKLDFQEKLVPYTGTLFTFENLLRVEFLNNTISNVQRSNSISFYNENSLLFKNFGYTVKDLDGQTFENQIQSITNSSSMISALNVYELALSNISLSDVDGLQTVDSVVLNSVNGMKNLSVSNSSFSNLTRVESPLFNLSGVSFSNLTINPENFQRQINFTNSSITNVTIGSTGSQVEKALLMSNFEGQLSLESVQMRLLNISNVTYPSQAAPPAVTSLLKVASGVIFFANNTFSNISLLTNKTISSPVNLQIFNFTQPATTKPLLSLDSNRFERIQQSFSNSKDAMICGLFTFYHDVIDYDIKIQDTVFEDISVEFVGSTVGLNAPIEAASILQTIQTKDHLNIDTKMSIAIINTNFSKVFRPLSEQALKHELFRFQKPILMLELNKIEFVGFQEQFAQQNENGMVHDQITQKFDARKGPQQITIRDSIFIANHLVDTVIAQQNLTALWKYKQIASSNSSTKAQPARRHVFAFENFDGPSFFVDPNYTPRAVAVYDIVVANIDFRDHPLEGAPVKQSTGVEDSLVMGAGSFIWSRNSNLLLRGIQASNLSSSGNSTFLKVENGPTQTLSTRVQIHDSRFENCSALVGGVLYSTANVTMTLHNVSFETNFAIHSGAMFVSSNESSLGLDSVRAVANRAHQRAAFGTLLNFGDQRLTISFSEFDANDAGVGEGTLALVDSSAQMSALIFRDNKASVRSNVLILEHISAPEVKVTISDSKFDATSHFEENPGNINGSFVHIVQADRPDKPGRLTKVYITRCAFLSGASKYGGAIYAGKVQNLTLQLTEDRFENNKAQVSGGAIFLDGFDSYQIDIDQNIFKDNKGRRYGDNIFSRQRLELPADASVSSSSEPSGRRLQLQEPTAPAIRSTRNLTVSQSIFTTPNSDNQLYFQNIETLTLVNLTFAPNAESLSLEGGSLYLSDCVNVSIVGCTFDGQAAQIRGGAIFANQSENSWMRENLFSNSLLRLSNNTFRGCRSQQGGALYTVMVQRTVLENNNVFNLSEALKYPSELIIPAKLNPEVEKVYERLTQPNFMGKGPAVYFNCTTAVNCTFQVGAGTALAQSLIYDVQKRQHQNDSSNEFTNIKSFFYTEVRPIVPDDLRSQLEQQFLLYFLGSNAVFVTNAAEAAGYIETATIQMENQLPFNYVPKSLESAGNQTSYERVFNLSLIETKHTPVLAGKMFIVNSFNEIQTYDNSSALSVSVSTNMTEYIQPELAYNATNGTLVRAKNLTFKAQNFGFFVVPPLVVYGMPGGSVNLTFDFKFNQSDATVVRKEFTYTFTSRACADGQIVDSQGHCQHCDGPDQYLLEKADPHREGGLFNVQDCSACEKDVYSCYGGDNIQANAGFQLLNPGTATFVKCDALNGDEVCLANNTCAAGYEGVLCKQCKPFFFRDFDGTCSECPKSIEGTTVTYTDSTFTIFTMIFYGALVLLVMRTLMLLVLSGQHKDRASTGFFYLKNIITYAITFVLLSELYGKQWASQSLEANADFRTFVQIMRWFYRVPLNTVDYQCYQDAALNPTAVLDAPRYQNLTLTKANLTTIADSAQHGRRASSLLVFMLTFTALLLLLILSFVLRTALSKPKVDEKAQKGAVTSQKQPKTSSKGRAPTRPAVASGPGQQRKNPAFMSQIEDAKFSDHSRDDISGPSPRQPAPASGLPQARPGANAQLALDQQPARRFDRDFPVNDDSSNFSKSDHSRLRMLQSRSNVASRDFEGGARDGELGNGGSRQRSLPQDDARTAITRARGGESRLGQFRDTQQTALDMDRQNVDGQVNVLQQEAGHSKDPEIFITSKMLHNKRQAGRRGVEEDGQSFEKQEYSNRDRSVEEQIRDLRDQQQRQYATRDPLRQGDDDQDLAQVTPGEEEKEVEQEASLPHRPRHRFEATSLALMLLCFMCLVQFCEQMMLSYQCEPLKVANQAARDKAEWAQNVEVFSFNRFDSSVICDPAAVFQTTEFYCTLAFLVVFVLLAPLLLLFKAWREVVIDVVGMLCKVALAALVKYFYYVNAYASVIAGAFIVTFHFLVFLAFKSGQERGDSKRLRKMKRLNLVDFWMHMTLCLSAYLALSLNLLVQNLTAEMISAIFVVLLVLNCLYVVFWAWKALRFTLKHMYLAPYWRPLWKVLTCACLRDDRGLTQEELEKEAADLRQQQAETENMLKIDRLIEQLNAVQKEILEKSQVSVTDRSGPQKVLQSQLVNEIEDMLAQNGINYSDTDSNLTPTPRGGGGQNRHILKSSNPAGPEQATIVNRGLSSKFVEQQDENISMDSASARGPTIQARAPAQAPATQTDQEAGSHFKTRNVGEKRGRTQPSLNTGEGAIAQKDGSRGAGNRYPARQRGSAQGARDEQLNFGGLSSIPSTEHMQIQFIRGSSTNQNTIEQSSTLPQRLQPGTQLGAQSLQHRTLDNSLYARPFGQQPQSSLVNGSSLPSRSENVPIQFIRGSSDGAHVEQDQEEEEDDAEVQPTQRREEFYGFDLNDTLGPGMLTHVAESPEALEALQSSGAFQNREIDDIMAALSSIRYDNALLKNKHLLHEVSEEVQRGTQSSGRKGSDGALERKLNETNQSLRELINFQLDLAAPGSVARRQLEGLLPIRPSSDGAQILSVVAALENLQGDLRGRAGIGATDLKRQIQHDLANKESALRRGLEKEVQKEDLRKGRSIFNSHQSFNQGGSVNITERSGQQSQVSVRSATSREPSPPRQPQARGRPPAPARQQMSSLLNNQAPPRSDRGDTPPPVTIRTQRRADVQADKGEQQAALKGKLEKIKELKTLRRQLKKMEREGNQQ